MALPTKNADVGMWGRKLLCWKVEEGILVKLNSDKVLQILEEQ